MDHGSRSQCAFILTVGRTGAALLGRTIAIIFRGCIFRIWRMQLLRLNITKVLQLLPSRSCITSTWPKQEPCNLAHRTGAFADVFSKVGGLDNLNPQLHHIHVHLHPHLHLNCLQLHCINYRLCHIAHSISTQRMDTASTVRN